MSEQMQNEFIVKSKGKWQFILIYLPLAISVLLYLFLESGIFVFMFTFPIILMFFFPFYISLSVPLLWIISKKVPKRIFIDPNTKKLFVQYNAKKILEYDNTQVAYHLDKDNLYTGLTIYQIEHHARAGYVCKEKHSIVAPILSISWRTEQLRDIARLLQENNYLDHKPKKPKPFWDYVMSVK